MTRLPTATKAVFRYRRPEPWCWAAVVEAACDDTYTSWYVDQAVLQAGPAVSAHADLIAETLGRGSVHPDNVLALALALAGMGDVRALPALWRLAEDNRLPSLRGAGFARAHLWTLRDTHQSRRFYTKAGFTESGATRTCDFGDGRPLTQVEYERTSPGQS
ncbi:hypothetical protein ACFCYM_31985 [Streptomyces sp. NPDC056254]|uniref:hypothetical protein n=1 Tax=Streptomyces sp. NPDC056254 TaxID=3345763 RepID=UPI0035E076F4